MSEKKLSAETEHLEFFRENKITAIKTVMNELGLNVEEANSYLTNYRLPLPKGVSKRLSPGTEIAVFGGNKISGIKAIRDEVNCNLKEAQRIVESYPRPWDLPSPRPTTILEPIKPDYRMPLLEWVTTMLMGLFVWELRRCLR